jgi:GT2 family glycosyltransferase
MADKLELKTTSSSPMRGSIIVCTYRREDVLCQTIKHLLVICPEDCELLVVDQCAQHSVATTTFLQQAHEAGQLRYFDLQQPGLTRARNFGAQRALGKVLIFLDDDVVPSEGLIEAHLSAYVLEADLAAVAGQVLNPGETPQNAPGRFFHNQQLSNFQVLYGANFSIRRSVFLSVGGADERLGVHAYTEDVILANRLIAAAAQITFEPRASVRHLAHPQGGCRITDSTQRTPEWTKSHSKLYLFHLQCRERAEGRWRTLWQAIRHGPLRKQNVVAPWRQPRAWVAFAVAFVKARRHSSD